MKVKEIVIISGKGGTGKTTVTSSIIPKMNNIVIADCDVDAPDLDILLNPEINNSEDFISTSKAFIEESLCTNCGLCLETCNFGAIKIENNKHVIKTVFCEGCKACTLVCKKNAISIKPHKTGEIFESTTNYGSMIHGRLTPGEEVSGRLVSEVRKRAQLKAAEISAETILIDGPPGIACNVISAITGCTLAIIVTEPTLSGFHDLKRVQNTAEKLSVKTAIIINKSDLSEVILDKIKKYANDKKINILGEIPLSKSIADSINRKEIPTIENINIIDNLFI